MQLVLGKATLPGAEPSNSGRRAYPIEPGGHVVSAGREPRYASKYAVNEIHVGYPSRTAEEEEHVQFSALVQEVDAQDRGRAAFEDIESARITFGSVNPATLGSWLNDLAQLLMNFVVVMVISEILLRKRVFSDAILIALFVVAFGWWSSVRKMRRQAEYDLSMDVR